MIDPEEFLRSHPAVISAGTDADKADSGNGAVSRDASERRGRRYAKRRGRTGARRDAGSADRDEAAGTGPDGGDELKDCFDSAVASLNAADALRYQEICRCEFGTEGFDDILNFAADCKRQGISVVFSVVDVIGEEQVARAKRLAEQMGIPLRVRAYIG